MAKQTKKLSGANSKKKSHHKTIAEKLKKYEHNAVGHEFIPLLMFNIRRYLKHEKEIKSYVGTRMDRLSKDLPSHSKFLEKVLQVHDSIDPKTLSRLFSKKYLTKDIKSEVSAKEIKSIIDRSQFLNNRPVSVLVEPNYGKEKDCCCGDKDDPKPPDPPKNKYTISFDHLYCVDESDPEGWGDDEIFVIFGMITEEMVLNGVSAIAVHTPEYEDVEDGSRRPNSGSEGLRLYGFAGASPVASNLLITGTCFEADEGDISGLTDGVRSALTTAATTAAGAGGPVGWILAGASVIAIGITYLIDLWAADDQIGTSLEKTFTQEDCDNLTNASNPRILDALHFDGGDDNGINDVYLELKRV